MSMATSERKYALTKIEAGDYLLPSNDTTVLWRIRKGSDVEATEDGLGREVECWDVWRYRGPMHVDATVDPDDYDQWEHMESWLRTRQEAIDAAMRLTGDS